MNLSYWELKSWFSNVDFTIVGSGIVGLNCAMYIKKHYPKATVLIVERGVLPQGASTKNAGFACFGSLSEIMDDLKNHSENEVLELIKKRKIGLELLRENLGDLTIDYQQYGGYELFYENDFLLEECLAKRASVNDLLKSVFKEDVFSVKENTFKFLKLRKNYIFNQFEGQLDTGMMMTTLLRKVQSLGVKIINNCTVDNYTENNTSVTVRMKDFEFRTNKLLIASNGFAKQLLKEDVNPARAQVLITKPIKNLQIKGTFHLDKGFYYFRNVYDRILLGGGRNLAFEQEETTRLGQTTLIQNKLEEILKTTILPKINVEIEHRWSGIMGVGLKKKAIVKQISENVGCGVRLGGMGVAIGSNVGKELSEILTKN